LGVGRPGSSPSELYGRRRGLKVWNKHRLAVFIYGPRVV
jgi:hypothetical protein